MQILTLERLLSPLDRSLERLSATYVGQQEVRRLRWFWMDGLLASISAAFYGPFVALFAVAYGATNAQIGQLTAVASVCGMLALVPGARAIGLLRGRRKAVVVWFGGVLARLALLTWAILPFLVHAPGLAITVIIAANALNAFGNNFCNPSWTAMVADIVHRDMRGRFFSHRNLAINIANLAIIPLAGWLIIAGNHPGAPLAGYQIVVGAALVTGAVATFAFTNIDDPMPTAGQTRQWLALGEVGRAMRRAPHFLGLVGCTLVWNLGMQVSAPFMNVYLVRELGANTAMVGWITAAGSLTSILTLRWLGRLVDRKGNTWMQGLMSFIIPLTPLAWMVARAPWQVMIINGIAGILWTAYSLASFNLLLELAPEEARPEATALFQLVVAGSAVIAPLVGGYLADAVGFRPILAISGAVRMVGALTFFWWVARPAARRAGRLALRP
jgi:MFS family permease